MRRATVRRATTCISCERELPKRSRWQKPLDYVLPPPPFCPPEESVECFQVLMARLDALWVGPDRVLKPCSCAQDCGPACIGDNHMMTRCTGCNHVRRPDDVPVSSM